MDLPMVIKSIAVDPHLISFLLFAYFNQYFKSITIIFSAYKLNFDTFISLVSLNLFFLNQVFS